MKVCHFVASTGLGRGDAFVDLANAQSEQAEVSIIAPQGARFSEALTNKVRLFEYRGSNSRYNPRLYLELFRLFNHVAPDLVHTHFAKASEIYHGLNKILRLPHVATKHNPRKGRIYNRLKNVIAVSKGVAESIDHGNVEVIYNGIFPESVKRQGENTIFTILAVGRLDKIKRFDLLIDEVAKLDQEFLLNIVGDGEEKEALHKQIVELGLEEKVCLLGFRSDIPDLMADADLQVMSSKSEGFSLAMVEAIFYARVFMSTRVAGCVEVLPDKLIIDENGIAAKIKDVMNNYEQYVAAFSEVKTSFQERLDIRKVSKQYIDYYNRILNQ